MIKILTDQIPDLPPPTALHLYTSGVTLWWGDSISCHVFFETCTRLITRWYQGNTRITEMDAVIQIKGVH